MNINFIENIKTRKSVQSYLLSNASWFTWEINHINKKTDIEFLHDQLMDKYSNTILSYLNWTKLNNQYNFEDEDIKLRRLWKIGKLTDFSFSLKIKVANIEGKVVSVYLRNFIIIQERNKVILEVKYNLFSDYPRNKKTGELVDLTPYAKKNREFFNGLVKYLCEVTGGEVVEVYPKKEDKDLKKYEIWQAEEIDKKGFKALSERKEEYEEQERKKRFRKKFGIFGRLIP